MVFSSSSPSHGSNISKEMIAKVRIERLQKLCRDKKLQGILFIPGADGRFNHGSQAFMNWAFLGQTGKSLGTGRGGDDVFSSSYINEEDEALEDCIVMILPDGISIFYSLVASKVLSPTLARLRGVREYVTTQAEMDDCDLMEKCKVLAFMDMVATLLGDGGTKDGNGVGLPFPLGFDNARDLESWPLIQAHALDEMGGKGFFTARYQITDIYGDLMDIMAAVDVAFVENALRVGVPSLRHHLDLTFSTVDGDETWATRSLISEEDVSEPLNSLYDFGHVRDSQANYMAAKLRTPRALLGNRTALIVDQDVRPDKTQTAGGALHMVLEGEDPSSGLRFCRTYFLRANALPDAITRKAILMPGQEGPCEDDSLAAAAEEAARLNGAYEGLVQAMKMLQDRLSSGIEPCRLAEVLRSMISFPSSKVDVKENLRVDVEGFDALGTPKDLVGSTSPLLLYVRMILSLPGSAPAAVAIGDTFLFSPCSSQVALLTGDACAPYHRAWAGQGYEEFYMTRMTKCLADAQRASDLGIGHPLSLPVPHSNACLLLPSSVHPILEGHLRLFDSGMALTKTGLCPLVISFTHNVKDIRLCQPDVAKEHEITLLHMTLTQPLMGSVPFGHATSQVALVLQSDSPLTQMVLSQVPSWRLAVQQTHDSAHSLNALPLSLELGASLELYKARISNISESKKRTVDTLMEQELDHNLADMMNAAAKVENPVNEGPILVTVLLGLPGTSVIGLGEQIFRFVGGGEEVKEEWKFTPVTIEAAAAARNESFLSPVLDALTSACDSFPQDSSCKRILLAVCGLVSMPSLCLYLMQQFNGSRKHKISLASTCAVVSVDLLIPGRLAKQMINGKESDVMISPLSPSVWDQVSEGWCSSVVLTDPAPASGSAQFSTRLHQVNSHAVLLRAPSSRAYLEPDVLEEIIIKEKFNTTKQNTLRQQSVCPSWPSLSPLALCPCKLGIESFVQLSGLPPLALLRVVKCMKELFPNAVERCTKAAAAALSQEKSDFLQVPAASALQRATQLAVNKVQAAQQLSEDEQDLNTHLAKWRQQQKNAAVQHPIIALYGHVVVGNAMEKINKIYLVEASQRHISLTEASMSGVVTDGNLWVLTSVPSSSSTVAPAIVSLLNLAKPYSKSAKEPRTRVSITDEELQEIQAKAQAQQRPLPGDFSYDGKYYVDFYGTRLAHRPDLEELVGEYLKELNAENLD